MRTFLRAHWKAIVAILLLIVLAVFTVSPSAAPPATSLTPSLAERLRAHAEAIASSGRDPAAAQQGAPSARYIESVLKNAGYAIRRQEYGAGGQALRGIEVSIANVAPHAKPARIFIVGANYGAASGANENGGAGAVLELARLLKDMRPSRGTEIKFVFFANEAPPWHGDALLDDAMGGEPRQSQPLPSGLDRRDPDVGAQNAGGLGAGSFIAFVGTLESSRRVQQALSAFQAVSDVPVHGLAAPDYVQGVTLSDRGAYRRLGYPALMITDTAFGRYPYYKADDRASHDTPDPLDYAGVARVVGALARTIEALAGAQHG